MTTETITALAREYAEGMIKGKPSEELPNCLKNSMLTMNTEYIAEAFQWLTRRYCLVEKEKASALCRLTLEYGDSVDYRLIDGLTDWVMEVLPNQYHQVAGKPGLGKEAEG